MKSTATLFSKLLFSFFLSIVTINGNSQNSDWVFHAYNNDGSNLLSLFPTPLTTDDQGNIYSAGTVADHFQFGNLNFHGNEIVDGVFLNTGYIAKSDDQGNAIWAKVFEGGGFLIVHDVETDSDGNLLMVGQVSGEVTIDGMTIEEDGSLGEAVFAKFNPDGDLIWIQDGFISDDIHLNHAASIDINSVDDIVITGEANDDNSGIRRYVAHYDDEGSRNWIQLVGGPGRSEVAFGNDGSVFISGTFNATGTPEYSFITETIFSEYGWAYVARLSADGNLMWLNHYISDFSVFPDIQIGNLTVDLGDNSPIVSGEFDEIFELDGVTLTPPGIQSAPFFLAKYHSDGSLDWVKHSTSPTGIVEVNDIDVNSDGDIFLSTGIANATGLGPFTLGEGNNSTTIIIDGESNGALMKYNSQGQLDWMKGIAQVGGIGRGSIFRNVKAVGPNKAIANGLFTGSIAVGGTTLHSMPTEASTSLFMTSCNGQLSSLNEYSMNDHIVYVFPNPSKGDINILTKEEDDILSIDILAIDGQVIKNYLNPDDQIRVENLRKGTYLILSKNNLGISTQQFSIVK